MKIAGRFALAIAIPLTIFACLAGYDLRQTWQTRTEMAKIAEVAQGGRGYLETCSSAAA
jgi:hypothetical protein